MSTSEKALETNKFTHILTIGFTLSNIIHATTAIVLSTLWSNSKMCGGYSHILSKFHVALFIIYIAVALVKLPILLKHYLHEPISQMWMNRFISHFSIKLYTIAILAEIVLELVSYSDQHFCSNHQREVLMWSSRSFYSISFLLNFLSFVYTSVQRMSFYKTV
ncbi:unnamed protein product [Auanema sp. JU1783]|nr:unnamed protein product [Auanema sp. JU1783]